MGARLDRIVKGTLRGNLNLGTPSKGPRDLARAHQRAILTEERQLAAVAAALSKEPEPKPETPPPSPPPEATAEFDLARPFAEVRGEPGVGYVQGENYFSRDRLFVKRAPEHAWYAPEIEAPKAKAEALRAAHAEMRQLPSAPRAPKSILDAERENAKAAAAEALAE